MLNRYTARTCSLIGMLALLLACAGQPMRPEQQAKYHEYCGPFHALRTLGEKRKFDVSLYCNEYRIPLARIHRWTLRLSDAKGQPIAGAKIRLQGGMPQYGLTLPTAPRVEKYLDHGAYLIDGVKFSMPGVWLLNIDIAANNMQERAAFALDVK